MLKVFSPLLVLFFLMLLGSSGCGYNKLKSLNQDSQYYYDQIIKLYTTKLELIERLHHSTPYSLETIDPDLAKTLNKIYLQVLENKNSFYKNNDSFLKITHLFNEYHIQSQIFLNNINQNSQFNEKLAKQDLIRLQYYFTAIENNENECKEKMKRYLSNANELNNLLTARFTRFTNKHLNKIKPWPIFHVSLRNKNHPTNQSSPSSSN